MKILVAPLNWGLGHATRCIPIIRHYLAQGDEVVLAGDGESLLLLRKRFPELRAIDLPSLELHYTSNSKQCGFYIHAICKLIRFTIADHYYLSKIIAIENFDLIISDNRFGLFARNTRSVYITHQLYPILPKRLRIFQLIARALHACIYRRYDEVWVPDYADATHNLSGSLSHNGRFDQQAKYIGPLSRFANITSERPPIENSFSMRGYSVVAILSGLEPQRTLFEQEILQRFTNSQESVLLIRGKISDPHTILSKGNITILPSITDEEFVTVAKNAKTILARSGYSTIMDLEILGALQKAELHPTPGQSEQEYLLIQIHQRIHGFQKN